MTDNLTNTPAAYLSELQRIEREQELAKLRTLSLEFAGVLGFFPKLREELNAFHNTDGIAFHKLDDRLRTILGEAANLQFKIQGLARLQRDVPKMREFLQRLQQEMGLQFVERFSIQFSDLCDDIDRSFVKDKAISKQEKSWANTMGQDQWGRYGDLVVNGVHQRFRWIDPGSFLMGSPKSETSRFNDEEQHRVTLTQGFWLADTACTQDLWVAVMGSNPARFQISLEHPVERVSWDEIHIFLERFKSYLLTGGVRLPTESEWEYACRAGTKTAFYFGTSSEPQQINYDGSWPYEGNAGVFRNKTIPVKELPPNKWGLHQMHGNVWEWCQDRYGRYPTESSVDPQGDAKSTDRVIRGGSWYNKGLYCRSAHRRSRSQTYRSNDVGFRLLIQ
jgi:formylglycine-generating enzyme required for sulfatase activity